MPWKNKITFEQTFNKLIHSDIHCTKPLQRDQYAWKSCHNSINAENNKQLLYTCVDKSLLITE